MEDKTRLKRIWRGMLRRCYSEAPSNRSARWYRDKGIRVCDEWKRSFRSFEAWALENGYDDDLTIDRIDANGDYMPKNCRWVTRAQNSSNTAHRPTAEELIRIYGEESYWKNRESHLREIYGDETAARISVERIAHALHIAKDKEKLMRQLEGAAAALSLLDEER